LPTLHPSQALTIDQARELALKLIAGKQEKKPDFQQTPGRIGLEPEMFAFRKNSNAPPKRVPIWGEDGLCEILDGEALKNNWLLPREKGPIPAYPVAGGGRITFEPGGQIEYSTAPALSASKALSDVDNVVEQLENALKAEDAFLLSMGSDPWRDAQEVPQQLDAPRYRCMTEYFAKIGPHGAVMMRNTAGLQVNLDNGSSSDRNDRWLLSFLASPIITATFAASPGPSVETSGVVSQRALAWQKLDPSRTGFPRGILDGKCRDIGAAYAAAALEANVMLFYSAPDSGQKMSAAGKPGFSFEKWIIEGNAQYGKPTAEDLEFHMTTLFFEARLRGFIELRSADASSALARKALTVLAAGLLYDKQATSAALDLLYPCLDKLPEHWAASAREGVRNRVLGDLSRKTWAIALDGAKRLPDGFLKPQEINLAEKYLERYLMNGRMPADELLEATHATT